MKTGIKAMLCVSGLLVGCATLPPGHSEARHEGEQVQQTVYYGPEFTFAFDQSFQEHFGDRGIDIVVSAVKRGITDPDKLMEELKPLRFGYDRDYHAE